MTAPDYGRGTLALMASVELACGGPGSGLTPLPALPPAMLSAKRSVVVLIIDGLGRDYLLRTLPGSLLASHLLCSLDSVCPATTATAVTSFFTGLTPASHGLLGWFTPFEARDQVVLPLLARVRNGPGLPAPDLDTLYRTPPLAARLTRNCHIVTPRRIAGSAYTKHHAGPAQVHGYRSLGGMFGQLERLIRADGPPRYVHAYWPEFDHLAHECGVGHRRTREHLSQIEAQLAAFLRRLAGANAVLLVTSDHGFVDTTPQRSLLLNDYPALNAQLRLPLAGESRLAFVHSQPNHRHTLGTDLAEFLGDRGTVFSGEQFIANGFFGPGTPHPALAQRVGDWVVAMADGWTLRDRLPGEQPFSPVGVHGGLSDAERGVPLAVFEA
ncbi:alkaline phosphatase family protein [Immundisolibacter sp.]|uniref:alkaline phosphatase family protein n=1 Tax=Immundisolibacter sp. TaxID=1934948 RepID=UPI003565350F